MQTAEAFLIETTDGWHMVLVFEDGTEQISNEAFETRVECEQAFMQWVSEGGADVKRLH